MTTFFFGGALDATVVAVAAAGSVEATGSWAWPKLFWTKNIPARKTRCLRNLRVPITVVGFLSQGVVSVMQVYARSVPIG